MLVGGSVSVSRHFSAISPHGAVGDPRTASPEKGERFFTVIVERLAKLVGEIKSGRIDEFRAIGE
jgi:creatinine amidohydrolase